LPGDVFLPPTTLEGGQRTADGRARSSSIGGQHYATARCRRRLFASDPATRAAALYGR
jgi:hypothetical protein